MLGLAWLTGLSVGLAQSVSPALVWPAGASLLGAFSAPRGTLVRLAALSLAAFLLGTWRASFALPGLTEGPLTPYRGQVVTLVGGVDEPPRCGPSSCLVALKVFEVDLATENRPVDGATQVRTTTGAESLYGRTIQARGALRPVPSAAGFPRAELLARQGIHEVLDYPVIRPGALLDLPPRSRFESFRAGLEQRLIEAVAGPEGQLAAGLLLGREVTLAPELRAQLQATSTSHIIAVSGFNVAIVGGVVLSVAVRAFSRPWALALSALAVALYTALVGAPASALRAALMFGSAGLAEVVGRLPDPLTSLVLAGAIMGVVEPLVVQDLSFQLSFAATAGLVLLGGPLTPTWRHLPRFLSAPLGVTLAAQLATLPLIVHTFRVVSIVGLLTNVLIAPALPLTMGLAALSLLAGPLPGLGALLASLTALSAHYVLAVISLTASLPLATLATGSLSLGAMVAAYGALLAPLVIRHLNLSRRLSSQLPAVPLGFAIAIVGLAAVAHLASVRATAGDQLRALFFDAAGDGLTLLETPSGRRALLGSAGSAAAVSALSDRLPLLDRAIDVLVVTRAGGRDLDGLTEIARRYPIGLVVQPALGPDESSSRWSQVLAEHEVPTISAAPGMTILLDEAVQLEVDRLADGDGEGPPRLGLRLQFGGLDLRVLGGSGLAAAEAERTTVVRLAPELALSQDLRAALLAAGGRVAVVGGRRLGTNDGQVVHLPLGTAELLELTSDGEQVGLRRTPCNVETQVCTWP